MPQTSRPGLRYAGCGLAEEMTVRWQVASSWDGMKTAKKYLISGRVQGVGYRFFAERWGNELGICGYVKNCWDGNVEVYAIGDETSLQEFRGHLAEGPRSAHVTGIEEFDEPIKKRYTLFVIEGGW